MSLKMEGLRRLYGAAEPIRREMEMSFCNDYKPAQLGGPSNLHREILENRDCEVSWEDVFTGKCVEVGVGDVEMTAMQEERLKGHLLMVGHRQRQRLRTSRLPYRARGEVQDELVERRWRVANV